ncbi:MAG TPA: large conductance mechanosensitive channel protein MscL [Burkholderiaceae bacterium]|nr:large conductance mechanosensitive channel protein MscL [Burkholderiaceae bacterium]
MALLSEFREFAVKGNAIDLAVGVIIGAAFGKIVDSLVNDIVMPVIAFLLGGRFDFSSLYVPLGAVPPGTADTLEALRKAGVPVFAYGSFLTILINFALMAFVIFMLVRYLNRLKARVLSEPRPAVPVPVAPSPTEALLAEIRDELKAGRAAG